MVYPYASGNLLHERNTYHYSRYNGQATLNAWIESRNAASYAAPPDHVASVTRHHLSSPLNRPTLDHFVQRFEVTKRLHDAYTDNWRAVDKTQFNDLASYLIFAQTLISTYDATGFLPYLNVLLKLCDTLSSLTLLAPELRAEERRLVSALAARQVISEDIATFEKLPLTPPLNARTIPGLVAILCDSARAKAYIQKLITIGVMPERVIFLGPEKLKANSGNAQDWNGVFLPDLSQPVTASCAAAGIPVTHIEVADVNDPGVHAALKQCNPQVVLYAGLGGQIVSAETLECAAKFLHMHSGWLPQYRGSTTLYYALLNGEMPAVSAFWLDPEIDTGPLIARQHYPRPPQGMDVDQLYDASIRADLMGKVVTQIARGGPESVPEVPTEAGDEVYYVIHPVLKHIALLGLFGQPARVEMSA